ncbi:hotdog fold thioesterase [Mesobacillus harenae]|uniref:hotdog fold thioesterase n=1 Tax=Mesobacillus harenae TaxID=2213203 RepID=UPI00157FC564
MQLTHADIRTSFEDSPFFKHIGFEIVEFADDRVKVKLAIRDYLLNVNGTLHGGVHATMLDLISGMLLRSVTKQRVATTSLTTQYLAAVKQGEVFAEATIIQQGYKLAFVDSKIIDSENKLIAKGTGTFKIQR